jgi:hypothetical protein
MAQLISCFECGKPVSSEASNCPHCNTSSVNGVDCGLCGIRLKSSQSVFLTHYYAHSYHAHPECVQKVTIEPEPVEVRCSVCSYPTIYTCIKIKESGRERVSCGHLNNKCSNCGHGVSLPSGFERNTYGNCCHCNLLLKKSDNVQISSDGYVHNYCYSLNRNFQAQRTEYIELIENQRTEYIELTEKLSQAKAQLRGLHSFNKFVGISFGVCGFVVLLAAFIFQISFLYYVLVALLISIHILLLFGFVYTMNREPYLEKQIRLLTAKLK